MDHPKDPSLTPFAPGPFLIRLAVGFAILNLFVLLMAVVSLRQSRRNHEASAMATAQNLTRVLDHLVADAFGEADLAVRAVKDEVERVPGPRSGNPGLEAFIRRQHGWRGGLLALRITDAAGRITHGSGVAVGAQVSLADREHFIRLREDPRAGLVISRAMVGRITGKWVVVAARRLERPGGGFDGMAYAVLSLEQFQGAFARLDVGPHGSVALRDLDLGLVARHPGPEVSGTAVGDRLVSPEFRAFAGTGATEGMYRARTPFDGVQRTFSIRRVSGQPFYLLVGLAERDYLAGWRREVAQELSEVALFLCLTLVAAWLLRRAWLRQRAAHAHLQGLVAEVKILGKMLPICSHCKKIRDDTGYWNQLEAYLNEHTRAEFTHGICPDCAREVFPRSSGNHPAV